MLTFELFGLGLVALFFSALVRTGPNAARR